MWRTFALDEILSRRDESLQPSEAARRGLPFVEKIRFADGGMEFRESQATSRTGAIVARAGDLLVSKIRLLQGAVALVPELGEEICASSHCTAYEIKPGFDPEFVWQALRSPVFQERNERERPGSLNSKTELGPRRLLTLQLAAPATLDEQRDVAARAKSVREQRRRADLAAGAIRSDARGLADALRGEKMALAGTAVPLGDVADLQYGYAFKSSWYSPRGIRLLRGVNLAPRRIDWSRDTVYISPDRGDEFERFALGEGDIVIGMDRPIIADGMRVARLGAADVPALLVQRTGRFIDLESRLIPEWLFSFLESRLFRTHLRSRHERSVAVPHISRADVLSATIPLPDPPQQRQVLAELDGILQAAVTVEARVGAMTPDIAGVEGALMRQLFEPPSGSRD